MYIFRGDSERVKRERIGIFYSTICRTAGRVLIGTWKVF